MGFTFPSAQHALYVFLDGVVAAGLPIVTYKQLTVDFADTVAVEAAVLISDFGGTEDFLERTDRIGVDVYAEGDLANRVGQAISAILLGADLYVDGVGQFDTIDAEVLPHPIPYASDRINQSSAVYRIVSRPN
jgi:hypothetical protein